MLKLISTSTSIVRKNEKINLPEVVNQKLKLVISNSGPLLSEKPTISNSQAAPCFTVDVCLRGSNLYDMVLQDSLYCLKCDLILEVEESLDEFSSSTVICHFPIIKGEQLKDFVEEDEILFGMFMIQFQMKILEHVLLFCASHYASKLLIFVDDAQADELEIYRDFLSHEDQTITSHGEKTEMVIPADRETFDQWVDFMEEVNIKFQQTLWREQKNNPIIRQYLENHSLTTV